MAIKAIMNIVPITMAATLVGENVKVAKKKKITSKDLVKLGVTNIIGTSLIQTQSKLISNL